MSGPDGGGIGPKELRAALVAGGVDPLGVSARDNDPRDVTVYLLNGWGWQSALRILSACPWVGSARMAPHVHDGCILLVRLTADHARGDPHWHKHTRPEPAPGWSVRARLAGGPADGMQVDVPTDEPFQRPWRAVWVVMVDGEPRAPGPDRDDEVARGKGPMLLYRQHPQHMATRGRPVYVHSREADADARTYLARQILWQLRNAGGFDTASVTATDAAPVNGLLRFTAEASQDEILLVRELLAAIPGVLSLERSGAIYPLSGIRFFVETEHTA